MSSRADERALVKRGQEGQSERVRWVLEILEAGDKPRFSFCSHRAGIVSSPGRYSDGAPTEQS
jgi:hypothetical protein